MAGRFGGGFGFAVYLGKVRRRRGRAAQAEGTIWQDYGVPKRNIVANCAVDGRREATGKGRTTWLVVEVSGRRAARSEGGIGECGWGANIDELAGVVGASSYRAREVDTLGSCEWVARYWTDCSGKAGGWYKWCK